MADRVWTGGEQHTVPQLFARRLESDPDSEYLDVGGTKLSAGDVMTAADRFGGALHELGTAQHDRVASLLENSSPALLAWAGTVCAGRVAVPINTAYKGAYLTHQLTDSGARVMVVAASYLDRVAAIAPDVPTLEHVIVVDDADAGPDEQDEFAAASGPNGTSPSLGRVAVHRWDDVMKAAGAAPAVDVRPSDLATFIYTGGTTGLSKGCMLSHNYHEALARQIGLCWKRTADDVAWTPLPDVPLQRAGDRHRRHPPLRRARRHLPPLLGVAVLARDEPGRGHRHVDARDDGVPAGPRRRPPRDAGLRRAGGQPHPAPDGRRPAPARGGRHPPVALRRSRRSAVRTASPRPAWSPGSRPAWRTGPNAAGVVNDEYFDVRIFDDDDHEVAAGTDGEIVLRPKRPARDVRGLLGQAGGHGRDDAQPLVPHRRHRPHRRGPLPLLRRPQGGLPAAPGREHRQLRGGVDPHGPRRAGRRRGPRRPQPA